MKAYNDRISIETIADSHLEEFMRCPHEFYHKQVLGKRSASLTWREMVQNTVNRVVRDYYKLPIESRSSFKVMELIERYWVKNVDLFDSKIHYYLLLAKVTDHLLLYLGEGTLTDAPALLFKNLRFFSEELQINLAMTFQVVEWSKESFVIKKFLIEEDEKILLSFKHMAILFCEKVFQRMPERIEAYSMFSGKKHVIRPETKDISEAADYFRLTKKLLQDPKNYPKCKRCSLHAHAAQERTDKEKVIQYVM